jgi:5-hydroxyisourate hydrolase
LCYKFLFRGASFMGEQMGRLTTHVLDTARGIPAANLNIELWRADEPPRLIKRIMTNGDGRASEPLLDGDSFMVGTYELRFFAGDYLRNAGVRLPTPTFLDVVPVRFGIAHPDQHYHVPLLLSPYGYSTYRGS